MDTETKSLFDRISYRLGWDQSGDQLKHVIKKTLLKSDLDTIDGAVFESRFQRLSLSDSDCDVLRRNSIENVQQKQQWTMPKTPNSSEQKSFGVTLIPKEATEKDEIYRGKGNVRGLTWAQKYKQRSTISISDSSDEEFETFLSQLKLPKTTAVPLQTQQNNSLQDFIVDLEEECIVSSFNRNENWIGSKKGIKGSLSQETSTTTGKNKRLPEDCTDEDFIVKSYLYESCKDKPKRQQENTCSITAEKQRDCTHLDWEKDFKEPTICSTTNLMLQNDALKVSESSDEEFEILMKKVKNRTKPQTPRSTAKKILQPRLTSKGSFISSSEDVNCSFEETKKPCMPKPKSLTKTGITSHQPLPEWNPKIRSVSCSEQIISSNQWSVSCQVPGCFLQELSNPASAFVKNFKQKKEELTRKLYMLYNSSIFNQELPEKMEIIWNKNMRKTAGYCVTGQQKERGMLRYAKIELSEKVCDSADRLRDTLIHEICHAATWLINGVRDGHGQFWKFYAKKSTVVHPELPVVTRCHSYEINYKFRYKCSHCGTTIGRHSKSLDIQQFVCALCQGKLVLLQSTHKDGTPTKTRLTPFATSIKENYESSRKEVSDLRHSKLMRKLSTEFAASIYSPDS